MNPELAAIVENLAAITLALKSLNDLEDRIAALGMTTAETAAGIRMTRLDLRRREREQNAEFTRVNQAILDAEREVLNGIGDALRYVGF